MFGKRHPIFYLIVEISALEHKYRGRLQEIVVPLFFSKIPVFCFLRFMWQITLLYVSFGMILTCRRLETWIY